MGSGAGAVVPSLPLFLALLLLPLVAAGAGIVDEDVETLNETEVIGGDATLYETETTTAAASARKCCPPGLSMFRVNAPGCDNQVTCKITAGAATILWSLQPGGSGQYGFPTSCPLEQCRLVLLEGNDTAAAAAAPETHCVDHLQEVDASGQVVAKVLAGMACRRGAVFEGGSRGVEFARMQAAPGAGGGRDVAVVPFRKCCALHMAYDLATRTCVDALVLAGDAEAGEAADDVLSTLPPPADYESQRRAAYALMSRVLDKNLSSLVDMEIGFPSCEQSKAESNAQDDGTDTASKENVALLDVAVFDLPWEERLMDEHGVLTLRPESLRGADDERAPPMRLRPGDYCVDDAGAGTLAVRACLGLGQDEKSTRKEDVCQRYGCFRKCCPHDMYFAPVGGTHSCVQRPPGPDLEIPQRPQVHDPPATNLSDIDAYLEQSPQELVAAAHRRFVEGPDHRPQQVTFASIVDNICPEFRFRLDENLDVWFFDRLGTLYLPGSAEEVPTLGYCIDSSAELSNLTTVLMCLPQRPDPTQAEDAGRITLITVGLLISCACLALTLATYCCLPALQNLHGKTVMCHVSSLLVAYLILAFTQIFTKALFLEDEWICCIIGNCVLFTFLSAFSWLNVMCFDIWRTFGGMASSRAVKRSSASRRFRWYCAYAWGVSSAITTVCIVADQWPGNDRSGFRPQIGDGSCWFRIDHKAYGILIFFAGPLLVQTCSNLVLFVLTVRNYSRIKSEINRLHDPGNSRKVKKFQADSNKMKMNMKLFVVMGVTWVLEVVSTFFPREHAVFYVSDAANALEGVMIFIIFVFKRKVLQALAVRLGRAPPPPAYSTNPSIQADCRLAVRGLGAKTTSSNTLFTSDCRSSALSTR